MSKYPAISDLKVRASWGITGNQQFANYQQYAAYTLGDAQSQVQLGNAFVSTIRPGPYCGYRELRTLSTRIARGFEGSRLLGAPISLYPVVG